MKAFLLMALMAGLPSRVPPKSTATRAPAPALTDEQVKDRVDAYLRAIDTPITPAQWKALGPEATRELERRAQDPDALPSTRARAIDGLTAVPGPDTTRLMAALASDDHAPATVRRAAVRGVGTLVRPSELVRTLRPVLEDSKDMTVRQTAARVLATHGRKDTCAAVRRQLAREDENFKAGLGLSLEACK